ncbi:hypothetical protein FBU31_002550 [Coemansia sp. 'formosensis']|nr:hypothetical protein FBU31_002550 [Coemansia sp. 'formosensis']
MGPPPRPPLSSRRPAQVVVRAIWSPRPPPNPPPPTARRTSVVSSLPIAARPGSLPATRSLERLLSRAADMFPLHDDVRSSVAVLSAGSVGGLPRRCGGM